MPHRGVHLVRDFLSCIWTPGAGYGELRTIHRPRNGKPVIHQVFIDLSQPEAYTYAGDTASNADREGHDVYFGVLRRTRMGGTAADVVSHAPVLWADVDPYKTHDSQHPLDFYNEGGMGRVLDFPIPPSIIVDSGHGIHAYWLLRDAAPVADASLAMKGIAKDIGGDHTHDPARILRVPGTFNHKDPDNVVPVRLLRLDTTRRYRFSDFSEWLDKGSEGRGTPHSWSPQTYERRADLPPWLDELIANGAPRGSRSEQAFKVAIWLARFGYTDQEIQAVFASAPDGIGQKYAERGDRWLAVTLAAARAQA